MLPNDKKIEWNLFLDDITRVAYTQAEIDGNNLNETAYKWIKYLEKVI